MKTLPTITLSALLLALCLPASIRAQDGKPVWTNTYNSPINGDDEARAVALDASGNIYVTGAVFNNRSVYDTDYATIKYSSAGVMSWAKLFNGAGNDTDIAVALAVDVNSNVIVTGYSTGSGSGQDYTTIKYSTSGVALWTNIFNGSGNGDDDAKAIAVDGSGNVYVTGYSTGSGSGEDYATIKYSAAGLPLWTNLFNGAGNGNDVANAIAVDASGEVCVTGYTTGTNLYYTDYATIKYSAAGLPLWTNIYNGAANGSDGASAIKLDGDGNVYVTGSSQIATNISNNYAYATIKYSATGMALWTNFFNGTGNGENGANAMAVDASGNAYVTGSSQVSGFNYSYATIKYSADGTGLWTNFLNIASTNILTAFALALDGSGNVYVTGGPTYPVSGSQSVNYATVKYSTAGVPLWTNLFVGTANSNGQAYGIAVDANGNAYVTGDATDNGSGRDFVTIKYSGPPTPLVFVTTNSGFAPINQQFILKLTGPPGSNTVISAGTNLQTWIPLATNQLIGGTLQFTDKLATNYLIRFYRAKLQ